MSNVSNFGFRQALKEDLYQEFLMAAGTYEVTVTLSPGDRLHLQAVIE